MRKPGTERVWVQYPGAFVKIAAGKLLKKHKEFVTLAYEILVGSLHSSRGIDA